MVALVTSYNMLMSNPTRTLNQIASQPQNAHEIAYFKANIGSIKSVDDLMKNTRIYNFVMQAYGLQDMAYAKAYIRKVLTGGISDSKSFANQLTDPRFKALAAAFDFTDNGSSITQNSTLVSTTVSKYTETLLEQQAGQQSEGLQLALYFKANIANVTTSYGVMADAAIYKVVTTALGLPSGMSAQNIDQQAKVLDSKFKASDMQDPTKLNAFITRFLSMYDLQNGTSVQSNPAVQLFSGTNSAVDTNTLLSLQNIKGIGY